MRKEDEQLADELTRNTRLMFERFKQENKEIYDSQNELAKAWFLDPQNVDTIAKSICQYIFRDGVVEDYHKRKMLDDTAMKEINIFMVNHIAGLLTYALEGNWLQLRTLMAYFRSYCREWDTAEPATKGIDFLFYQQLKPQ